MKNLAAEAGGIVVCILVSLPVYMVIFGIRTGCENPLSIWRSIFSDAEFDLLTEKLFKAENLWFTDCRVTGDGMNAWIGNGLYGFELNGIPGAKFSLFQKRRFFRRYYQEKKRRVLKEIGA